MNAYIKKSKSKKSVFVLNMRIVMTKAARNFIIEVVVLFPDWFFVLAFFLILLHIINIIQRIHWARTKMPVFDKIMM